MSKVMEEEFKRWTAKRKAALVMEIIQGKTTVLGASADRALWFAGARDGAVLAEVRQWASVHQP